MFGRGQILNIDLTSEKVTEEPITEELCRNYIGGEGINTYLFWRHFLKVSPMIDPCSAANVIVWGLGPLGGTAYGGGSKARWTFKGPAYGMFADSTSGGAFSPQMRWAGYDHLVITGQARHPVYISINNDKVEIRDAARVWGKRAGEADNLIKTELGDEKIDTACIGPAGENLVTYASVTVSRYRASGRTGSGCVFGSKNLKGIAVRGTKGISVFSRAAFLKALDAELAAINRKPDWRTHFKKNGTLGLVQPFNDNGWNAFRNGQLGQSPAVDKLNHVWYFSHMHTRPLSCSPSCAAVCHAWHHIKGDESSISSRYIGEHGYRPEYGHAHPWGVCLDIRDLPTAIHLSEECNSLGLDILETAFMLGFLMELWQRGILTAQDITEWAGEPISLEWGNYESVEKLLHIIASQKTRLGEMLKGGGFKAGKIIEQIKGQPVLQYHNYGKGGSPQGETMRSRPQLAFGAAVAAIGGHHLKGAGIDGDTSVMYLGKPDAGNVWSYDLKGAGQAVSETISSITNSLGLCKFGGGANRNGADFPPELYAQGLHALTGMEISGAELLKAGERIVNLQKAFNSRLGMRREHDSVCYRWMYEPMPDGPGKGMKMADFLEEAKDEYYEYHGWDKATSLQKREKLIELGLDEIIPILEKEDALA